jgi:tRNA 2-selenouridine synthase
MPEKLYFNMQDTPAIILMMDINTRLPRLIEEYTSYPPEILKASVLKISKRLGGDNTRDAITAIESGDFAKAIEITLIYYDKAYFYGLKKKSEKNIIYLPADTDDIETNAIKILEVSRMIKW